MQTWKPDDYVENAGFVAELGMPVVALLNPQPGERILDLGCGDGDYNLYRYVRRVTMPK
jgi:2-isopropylmalate synthase